MGQNPNNPHWGGKVMHKGILVPEQGDLNIMLKRMYPDRYREDNKDKKFKKRGDAKRPPLFY